MTNFASSKPPDVRGKLGALQSGLQFDHLGGRVVTLTAAARRIDDDDVVFVLQWRQPDFQFAVPALLDRRRRCGKTRFDGSQLKDRFAAGPEAAFAVLCVLLPREATKVGPDLDAGIQSAPGRGALLQ